MQTTTDHLLDQQVTLIQPQTGYRVAIDPVLLAAAIPAPPRKNGFMLDLGAGVGAVGLCALYHHPHAQLTMVEKMPELCALAAKNIIVNHRQDHANIIEADITQPAIKQQLTAGYYSNIMLNPPFFKESQATPSQNIRKAAAHIMPDNDFIAWLDLAHACCKHKGVISMILPPNRARLALNYFYKLPCTQTILPIHPFADKPANRIILHIKKTGTEDFTLLSPLILHDNRARYPNHHPDRKRYRDQVDMILAGKIRL